MYSVVYFTVKKLKTTYLFNELKIKCFEYITLHTFIAI